MFAASQALGVDETPPLNRSQTGARQAVKRANDGGSFCPADKAPNKGLTSPDERLCIIISFDMRQEVCRTTIGMESKLLSCTWAEGENAVTEAPSVVKPR